ncbi:DUF4352 domain-containing protein [Nocardiopsis ganjiahuensis]|uniref:DUF4352 domain-containing protein n=1 Tax=Nocardiopsis ganjiahuensis TaxID=239984 RepID=UPI0009FFCEB3|nr:DUF4352 domain-containing protein [Nocardiopsis ganjiahuensis]
MSSEQDGQPQYDPWSGGQPPYGPPPGGQPPYGPPPGGQPPYGPPPGGQPQYGYQQYGPPQGPPQQYGYPPNVPPPVAAPGKRKKWPWILLAVFVLLMGMFACSAGGGEDTETASGGGEEKAGTEEAAEEESTQALGIGEAGQVGDWRVTVNGTETAPTMGDEYFEEQAQGEFVIVDLTVENDGSEATTFDDSALFLIDADGNRHSATTSLSDDAFFLEQINPGNRATGTAAFDVPEGTEAVALEVEDIWSFEEPIEISLD